MVYESKTLRKVVHKLLHYVTKDKLDRIFIHRVPSEDKLYDLFTIRGKIFDLLMVILIYFRSKRG